MFLWISLAGFSGFRRIAKLWLPRCGTRRLSPRGDRRNRSTPPLRWGVLSAGVGTSDARRRRGSQRSYLYKRMK
jgi:hypothetical protein